MKCPKCGYLGFDAVDRCRNCGYDFSLSASSDRAAPDLALRTEPPTLDPLGDLSLVDGAMIAAPATRMADAAPDLDRIIGAPTRVAARTAAGQREELPLF